MGLLSRFGLLSVLLCLSAGLNAKEILVGGSGTDLGTMRILAQHFSELNPEIKVNVLPSLGSSGGVKAVQKGKIDVGLTSRELKPKEKTPDIKAYRYARTPLVLATQSNSSAENISSETYFSVISGGKENWPDGQVIRVILRPPNDSDTSALKEQFPEFEQVIDRSYDRRGVPIARSDQDAANLLENISGGLGTTTLAVIHGEKRALKALKLDGVMPSPEALGRGEYQMHKMLYLVLPEFPDPAAGKFVRFVNSPAGHEILRTTGHLPESFDF